MSIRLRKARSEDRQAVLEVEKKATPGLVYLPFVFDLFLNDEEGEFIVAEAEGHLVACGKFTVLPDGSAWLETLRVIPEKKGQGIGKEFYWRFLEIARSKKIGTLRMYTGIHNQASKGLAEKFGFTIAGTYRGFKYFCQPGMLQPAPAAFQPVIDRDLAEKLLREYAEPSKGFLVINRTFYAIAPALAVYLSNQGQLYHNPATQSTIMLGARFLPQQDLHIGFLGGDLNSGLSFALWTGMQRHVDRLSCYLPASATDLQAEFFRFGFEAEASDLIVMETNRILPRNQ